MAISWTIIVLGTILQGMQCNADDGSSAALLGSNLPTSADSTKTTVPLPSLSSTKPTAASASSEPTTVATPSASSEPTKTATPASFSESTTLTTTLTTLEPTKLATPSSSPDSSTQAPTTKATSPDQTVPSSTVAKQDPAVAKQDPATNPPSQNDLVTTQITTIQSKTPNAGTAIIAFSNSPQNSPTTVIPTDPNQGTTNLNKPATTISTEVGTTQLKNPKLPTTAAPDSKSTASQSLGTTKTQTTTVSIIPGLQNENVTTSTSTPQNILNHSFDLSSSTEENVVRQACKTLGQKMKGNCTVTVEIQGNQLTANITIEADKKILPENYKPLEPFSGVTENIPFQKDDVNKDTIPDTLIAILASCGALVLILCCFAAYCTYHHRSYRKNQQHLTEELQTVENGYHDNPTLEVMEVQPEMQEKKLTMNREFNDSWIVPIDNLLKEDIPDEEDTHL